MNTPTGCPLCGRAIRWGRIRGAKGRVLITADRDRHLGNLRYQGKDLEGDDLYVVLSHDEARDARADGLELYARHTQVCRQGGLR